MSVDINAPLDTRVILQHVIPMPGTVQAEGKVIVDALTVEPISEDNVIGQWQDDGAVITPLDEAAFMKHLPDTVDEEGNATKAVLHEPHRWAGWPELFG